MAVTYKRNLALFEGTVGVEEAEGLLGWSQKHPKARLDFTECTHVHAAHLQVLMAAKLPVAAWPRDSDLKTWLEAALRY